MIRYIRFHFKALSLAILSLLTTSCLVDTKDVPDVTIYKTDNNLRLVQDGDFIDYNFGGTMTTNDAGTRFFNGRIEISWASANNVVEPLDGGQFIPNLFKETTTVIEVKNDGTESLFREVFRYISQDQATGTIYLEAFDDSISNPKTYFWSSNELVFTHEPPVTLLPSPMTAQAESKKTTYFFQGCDGVSAPCTSGKYIAVDDTYNIQDNSLAETLLGDFQSFRINYSSWTATNSGTTNPPTYMDLRKLCTDATKAAGHISGNMDIYPQLGIVRMESICNSGTDLSYSFIAEISNTNIVYQ